MASFALPGGHWLLREQTRLESGRFDGQPHCVQSRPPGPAPLPPARFDRPASITARVLPSSRSAARRATPSACSAGGIPVNQRTNRRRTFIPTSPEAAGRPAQPASRRPTQVGPIGFADGVGSRTVTVSFQLPARLEPVRGWNAEQPAEEPSKHRLTSSWLSRARSRRRTPASVRRRSRPCIRHRQR